MASNRGTEAADFSQSGEQEAILAAVDGLEPGRFLDIGAGDGRTFSNTIALATKGWTGLLIEPAPWAFAKLLDLYADRPDMRLCNAAVVAAAPGPWLFHYSQDDHLSTLVESEAEKWSRRVTFRRFTVAAITLDQLLEWHRWEPSVVSIDAEGMTNQLVAAYERHPAWGAVEVICFEREDFASRGSLALAPPFELIATTPNNFVYRRVS